MFIGFKTFKLLELEFMWATMYMFIFVLQGIRGTLLLITHKCFLVWEENGSFIGFTWELSLEVKLRNEQTGIAFHCLLAG